VSNEAIAVSMQEIMPAMQAEIDELRARIEALENA